MIQEQRNKIEGSITKIRSWNKLLPFTDGWKMCPQGKQTIEEQSNQIYESVNKLCSWNKSLPIIIDWNTRRQGNYVQLFQYA